MIDSGRLDQRVTLDVPDGASGGYLPLTPATWHCEVVSEAIEVLILRGRYHVGITTATRVHRDGRTFHVDAVVHRRRDDESLLTCREVFD